MSVLAMIICFSLLMSAICWHAKQLEWSWRDIRRSCWDGLLYWGCWSGIFGMIKPAWLSVVPYVVVAVIIPYSMYRMEPQHTAWLFETQLSKLPLLNPGRTKKLLSLMGLTPRRLESAASDTSLEAEPHALPGFTPPAQDTPQAEPSWGETRYIGEDPSPA